MAKQESKLQWYARWIRHNPVAAGIVCALVIGASLVYVLLPPEERADIGAPGGVLLGLLALATRVKTMTEVREVHEEKMRASMVPSSMVPASEEDKTPTGEP